MIVGRTRDVTQAAGRPLGALLALLLLMFASLPGLAGAGDTAATADPAGASFTPAPGPTAGSAADPAGADFTPAAEPAEAAAATASLASSPPGRYLSIKGPVSVTGTAPLPMEDLPIGEYKLFASGPGLPSVRGRFVRSETGLYDLGWAGPTALIYPPGLTHLLRGEWIRGATLLAVGGGAGAMAVRTHTDMQDAESELDAALQAYGRAVSEEAIREARLDVWAASQRKNDEEEVRNLWAGLLGASWLASGVEVLFLTPQPRLSGSDGGGQFLATLPTAGGMGAAFRSLLVPGAGQRYMGQDTRGNFFFTLTAALAAGAIVAHDEFLTARRDQSEAQRRFDEADQEEDLDAARADLRAAAGRVDDKQTLRWALVGTAAGVHLWNVLDAFGLGDRYNLPELRMTPNPETDGIAVGASWSIP